MSLKNKLNKLARSEKGKELIDKAQTIANDPKNRAKLDDARQKIEGQVGAAKHKLAEKRAEKQGSGQPAAGAAGAPTPDAASETPPPPHGGDEGPKAA